MRWNLIGEVLFDKHSYAKVQVKINTISEKEFSIIFQWNMSKVFSPETYSDLF